MSADFASGATMAASLIIAVFFFRYGLRLLAFLLILAAIVDKNRGGPPAPVPDQNGRPDAVVRRVEAR